MIIRLKNKDTLNFDDFSIKCVIGKNGLNKNKKEGDKSTPIGNFKLGPLYWRADKIDKPETNISCKKINKNLGWCNDIDSRFYNKEIKVNKKIKHEKLFRKDYKYNLFLVIKYNDKKIIKGKGSAIFIHLTKNYKKTAGCIAVKEKDFLVMIKLLSKKSKIIIS
tara:strand:- start:524 stop:1015 length:492 start_codon:yes stop_codon:yes gene_type:complete